MRNFWFIPLAFIIAINLRADDFPVGHQCSFTWDANDASENVDLYRLEFGTGNNVLGSGETPETTITCEQVGLDSNVPAEYWAQARAHNSYGWSDPSNRITFSFGEVPQSPRNVIINIRIELTP